MAALGAELVRGRVQRIPVQGPIQSCVAKRPDGNVGAPRKPAGPIVTGCETGPGIIKGSDCNIDDSNHGEYYVATADVSQMVCRSRPDSRLQQTKARKLGKSLYIYLTANVCD